MFSRAHIGAQYKVGGVAAVQQRRQVYACLLYTSLISRTNQIRRLALRKTCRHDRVSAAGGFWLRLSHFFRF